MFFSARRTNKAKFTARQRQSRSCWHRPALQLEPLEERALPSTLMVKDINTQDLSSSPTALVALGNQVYFEATDGTGEGLYKSDGTAANTTHVASSLTSVSALTLFKGVLYFTAYDTTSQQTGLYKDDGSSAPTPVVSGQTVSGIYGNTLGGTSLPVIDGYLYFTTFVYNPQTGQSTQTLERTDGSADPTVVFSGPGNSGPGSIGNLILSGNYLYFTTSTSSSSPPYTTTQTLYAYKADGSAGAPTALADNLSGMSNLTAAGGVLYFTTSSNSGGISPPQTLYQTDGTTSPTQLAANLTGVGNLTSVGGYLFFTTSTSSPSYTISLDAYKADGSSGAPTQIASNLGGSLNPVVPLGNKAYFTVMDPASFQTSLYSSDGTTAGTGPLAGSPTNISSSTLTLFGGELYFGASGGLYRTDGSSPTLFSDSVDTVSSLTVAGGFLYITSSTTSISPPFTTTLSLYRTDGTAAPTRLLSGLNNSAFSFTIVPAASSVYIFALGSAASGNSATLYRSDGTLDSGSLLASGLNINYAYSFDPTPVSDNVFFSANDGQHGQELWAASATTAGMVKNINTVSADSSPTALTTLNGLLYFEANDGTSAELYQSDGTAANTFPVVQTLTNVQDLTQFNGALYFLAQDTSTYQTALYTSNGTAAGTQILSLGISGTPTSLTQIGGALYLTTSDTQNIPPTEALYRSDGTPNGTSQLASGLSTVAVVGQVGNYVYFTDNSYTGAGGKLYRSDGTANSATLLVSGVSNVSGLIQAGNLVYFTAFSGYGVSGGLYCTDGTAADTIALTPSNSYVTSMTALGDKVYFLTEVLTNGGFQTTLNVSDGTVAGTVAVSLGVTNPEFLTQMGGVLYFMGTDPNTGAFGLYQSDGTANGTVALSLGVSGSISYLTQLDGRLYITTTVTGPATQQTTQNLSSTGGTVVGTMTTENLYSSDGTAAGTILIASNLPNGYGLTLLGGLGGYVYFNVTTSSPASQQYTEALYRSNGTVNSATLLNSFVEGNFGLGVTGLTLVGSNLFFSANDGTHGQELWVNTNGVAAPTAPVVTSPTDTAITTTTATLGGTVVLDGGTAVTARGIVLALTSDNANPTLGGTGVIDLPASGTIGTFTVSATDLTPGASYSYAAYATNSVGTSYTTVASFQATPPATAPTVASPTATSITTTSATLAGTVSSDGGNAITARGIVVALTSDNANPTLGGAGVTNLTASGTTGTFTVNPTGLTPGASYSYAAYATNSIGTTYTSVATFQTATPTTAPTVDSPTATAITAATATLGGRVSSDGGDAITARGIVVALTSDNVNPILGGTGVSNLPASGTTGTFTVSATGLTPGVSYSYAAYATNSVGTTYSSVTTFVTTALTNVTVTSDHTSGSTYGQTVTFTATVNRAGSSGSTPTGTVQFDIDGNAAGTPVALANGSASSPAVSLTTGPHTITALYTSDSGNFSSSDNHTTPFNQIVNARPLTVTADTQTKQVGTADPALTYQVTAGSLLNGDSFSGALSRVAGETVGTYAIQQGTLTAGSNYALHFVPSVLYITSVSTAPTSSESIPVSSTGGPSTATATGTTADPAELTATTSELDGILTVTKFDSAPQSGFTSAGAFFDLHFTPSATPPLNSQIVLQFQSLTPNSALFWSNGGQLGPVQDGSGNAVVADAAGDATVTLTASSVPSISQLTGTFFLAGQIATTTTVTAPAASELGQPVTFTATVTATVSSTLTPTGTVQFDIDGVAAGAPVTLVNGSASLTTATLTAGAHTITAFYSSDSSNFNSSDNSAAPFTETITQTTPPAATPGAAATVGAFDPATGTWYLRNSNTPGAPDAGHFAYGSAGWIAVTGDWNGDGTTTIGVVDPATMTWYLRNSNSPGAPDITPFRFGAAGWIPVVGDWNGDGTTTIGVVDPTTMTWYLKNSNGPGAPDITPFRYGAPSWIPVAGDWNGDGTTTIGVFDPIGQYGQSPATWYLKNDNAAGQPSIAPFAFGAVGWKPVVGDWNGDGRTTIGVVDASGVWHLRNGNSSGATDAGAFAYGSVTYQMLTGDWSGRGPALRVLGGQGPDGAGSSSVDLAGLTAIRAAALQRLQNAGVSAGLLAKLSAAQLEIDVLPPTYLATALPAQNALHFDQDAAGHGWFVDPTPLANEEFQADGTAVSGGPADGRVDLMTAMLHELGNLAGLSNGTGLTSGQLAVGSRETQGLDAVFAGL